MSMPTVSLGARNGIYCGGLEHKMGIHGNATAQIVIDGAVGTLVGQPNKGLAAMFVMMNAARLGVGNQSLGLTEVAYQNAAGLRQGPHPDAFAVRPQGQGQRRPTRSSCTPMCARCCSPPRPMPKAGARWRSSARCCSTKSTVHPDEKVRKDSAEWWRC